MRPGRELQCLNSTARLSTPRLWTRGSGVRRGIGSDFNGHAYPVTAGASSNGSRMRAARRSTLVVPFRQANLGGQGNTWVERQPPSGQHASRSPQKSIAVAFRILRFRFNSEVLQYIIYKIIYHILPSKLRLRMEAKWNE